MKQQKLLCLLFTLITLSGCRRVVKWGEQTFNQGNVNSQDVDAVKKYIKTVRIYDSFTTAGIFHVLPQFVRVEDVYEKVSGKDCRAAKDFVIYILAFADKTFGPILTTGGEEGNWQLTLNVDGYKYLPKRIVKTKIDRVRKLFFGDLYSDFYTMYRVSFDVKSDLDKSKKIKLLFKSWKHHGSVNWLLNGNKE